MRALKFQKAAATKLRQLIKSAPQALCICKPALKWIPSYIAQKENFYALQFFATAKKTQKMHCENFTVHFQSSKRKA